uniref:NADH-ubiquinone oxidoreductase chain 5 n=2 Tax=Entransia fimbriata TaxID=130991 RepID=U5YGN7_9VIRI|nr:NADH dehydrogenase subunit 5 [Entransia fimbriata]AGZ90295.1 NADH dehydrogenase subunit 5 [Entransia fimbriata]
MYLVIIALPLLGSIVSGLFGRVLGSKGAAIIATSCIFFSFFGSCLAFYEVAFLKSICYIKLAPWFDSLMFDACWGFQFDTLAVIMLFTVTCISSLVHLYSISYMSEDPFLPRFLCYLSLFTGAMLILVTGDNFIQLFLGWEGIGLASYLLINFWYTSLQANKSAIQAMLLNRIGDFGLALGIMGCFAVFRSVDFNVVFAAVSGLTSHPMSCFVFLNSEWNALTILSIFLFIGAVGKSAQLGLHTWLPFAMAAPTPVSALLHAATLVTAGVYLIARCSPIFEHAPNALILVTFIGAMTTFFAASTGALQNDLKKIIAFSTCSQLGYMIFACGLSCYSVGIFHLMNHAFFKALLFLSAGSVIHAISNEQDVRKLGGLKQILPFTYSMMLIGSLALVGFPFLTGFYSKDVILEVAYAKYTATSNFAFWLGSLSVCFTSYYSFRLLFSTFLASTNAIKKNVDLAHEAPFLMAIPLILLAMGSLFMGFLTKDMMIGLGTDFWGNSIYQAPHNEVFIESEFGIPTWVKILPLFLTLGGASTAFLFIFVSPLSALVFNTKTNLGKYLFIFLNKRWLFDKVYNEFVALPFLKFGYRISQCYLDKGVLEILGPLGIINTFRRMIFYATKLQTGYIYHYAFIILISLTAFITFIGFYPLVSFWVDSRILAILFLSCLF